MSEVLVCVLVLVLIAFVIVSPNIITSARQKRHENVSEPVEPARPAVEPPSVDEKLIPPGNTELLEGPITLKVDSGAKPRLVSYVALSLAENPNIQVISQNESGNKDFQIRCLIKKPLPLFQILYFMPVVQEVRRKGNNIHIVTI